MLASRRDGERRLATTTSTATTISTTITGRLRPGPWGSATAPAAPRPAHLPSSPPLAPTHRHGARGGGDEDADHHLHLMSRATGRDGAARLRGYRSPAGIGTGRRRRPPRSTSPPPEGGRCRSTPSLSGGSPSRESRVRLLADRRQAITARGGKGGGGAQGLTGAVVLSWQGTARRAALPHRHSAGKTAAACSEPRPRRPGLPSATVRLRGCRGACAPSGCAPPGRGDPSAR